jgi:DNA polymerase I-like protein with 3'-5' exonuclease and polymerase domains
LQNLPTRDPEIGDAVRSCFQAEEGEQWGKLDYASQEPRLGVHIAEKAKIKGAREMADRFRADPNTDLHGQVATMMSIPRGQAKTINLAIWYGAGGAEICRRLNLPTERRGGFEVAGAEGQRLIDNHMRAFPFIKGLQQKTKEAAEQRGWVQTIGGRRCHFQKDGDEYQRTYKACNSVIQGSAADQMKAAQVQLRRAGFTPLIVVHDDCNVSIPMGQQGEKRAAEIKEIMESSTRLNIPVLADVKIGDNWAAVR